MLLNRYAALGRLTREPEARTFNSGAKLAKFGLAVNNRRRDDKGEWIDDPVFLDCECWDTREGQQLATNVMERLDKGMKVLVERRLVQDNWESEGQKRSKIKLVLNGFELVSVPTGEAEGKGKDAGKKDGKKARTKKPRRKAEAEQGEGVTGPTPSNVTSNETTSAPTDAVPF